MEIRLGIIGVEDTLTMIKDVADGYSEFRCFPFDHKRDEDIIDILSNHSSQIDMWLMSGYYPYSVALNWGKVQKPIFFIPYTGAGLYRTLYQLLSNQNIKLKDMSFDGVSRSELNQIFDEMGVDFNPDQLCDRFRTVDDIVEHHYSLYSQGKTKMAVTCGGHIRDRLQELGVPFSRVIPTPSSIDSVLNTALRTYEMLRFKERQIAVQMFEIDEIEESSHNNYSSDEIYHTQLGHMQKLLAYAKRIQGSLKTVGHGRYVIFTTSGALQEITNQFTAVPEIEEIQQINKREVFCGIGIGQSAYEAEIHAGLALSQAKKYGVGNWMVVFENQTVHGPLGRQEKLTYSYNSGEFRTISKQTTLSVMTIGKINAILEKIGKMEVSAAELAQHMLITPRSARRILMKLEQKGFAKESGEENPYLKGRPRKIYRITLH